MLKNFTFIFSVLFLGACGSSIEGKGATSTDNCESETHTRCPSVGGAQGTCVLRANINSCPSPTPVVNNDCPTATHTLCAAVGSEPRECIRKNSGQSCPSPKSVCEESDATHWCAEVSGVAASCKPKNTACPTVKSVCNDASATHWCEEVNGVAASCNPTNTACPAAASACNVVTHRWCDPVNGQPKTCIVKADSCPVDNSEEEEEDTNTNGESGNNNSNCGGLWQRDCDENGTPVPSNDNSNCGGLYQSACTDGNTSTKRLRPDAAQCRELQPKGFFLCNDNTMCLFPEEVKDGENDCANGEDETTAMSCPTGMSQCEASGTCFFESTRCDREMIDCPDSFEDEKLCPYWDGEEEANLDQVVVSIPLRYTCESGETVEFRDACGSTAQCGDTREVTSGGAVCEAIDEFISCQNWNKNVFLSEINNIISGFYDDEYGIREECKPLLPGSCSAEQGLKMCGNECIQAGAVCQLSGGEDLANGLCDKARDMPELIHDGEQDCPNNSDEEIDFQCPENTYDCGKAACIPMSEEAICNMDFYICQEEVDKETLRESRGGEFCGFEDDGGFGGSGPF